VIVIGVDPHKSTHTATALDPATNTDVGSLRIEASLAQYQRLIAWAKPWPERTWAIENADGLGHHLALMLCQSCISDVSSVLGVAVRSTKT
jgi:transposase